MKWNFESIQRIELSKLTRIRTGKLDANANSLQGKYPFFTCAKEPLNIDSYSYDCEAVLVAGNGDLNVKYYKGKFDAYQRTYIIESIEKQILDVKYLYYFMAKYVEQLRQISIGGVIKYIKLENLTGAKIPVPSLEIQKKIVSILEKAGQGLEKRKMADLLMEQYLQSIFIDMFGDPLTNPKKWDVRYLEQVADVISGVTKGRKLEGKQLVNVPYMRVANVQDGALNLNEIKTIDVLPSDVKRYRLQAGDLLMTEGGDPDKLGRCALWRGEIEECIHQNHIFRVRVNTDILLPEYASFLVGNRYGKNYFLRAGKQTTGIATINSKQLKAFPIFIPPKALQVNFTQIVNSVREASAKQKIVLENLNILFASLMNGMFEKR